MHEAPRLSQATLSGQAVLYMMLLDGGLRAAFVVVSLAVTLLLSVVLGETVDFTSVELKRTEKSKVILMKHNLIKR